MLFSSEVDIDHILPYSKTLDDTPANKVIAHSRCNRKKGNRTPFDAFGHTPQWPAIMELADRLPKNKRWRFAPDALQAFEAQGGFEARQLKDTQYLSKMAHQYLSALYSDKGAGSSKVWVIPGRLIEMLRRNWGLNSLLPDHNFISNAHQKKNRLDHRHHAIDAAVIALTDRSLLQRLSRFSAQQEAQELERVVAKLDLPWPGFRDDLKHHLDAMVVSHKADHGTISVARRTQGRDTTAGRLHNDTAYGLTNEQDEKGSARVVRRVPLSALETPENLSAIRDKTLRKALEAATMGKDKMAFKASLRAFAKNPSIKGFDKIRRVRVLETLNVIPIHDAKGVAYKGYKGDANYCYEVWQLPDGKWVANTVTMFEAHQAASATQDRRPHPAARRVLKLFKDDLIKAAFKDGQETVYRVVKFSKSGNLVLAPHYEGGALQERDTNKQDPFKYTNTSASSLKKAQARQIRINPLGYVWDPGPRT